mgnify:CR=1 FL=1
MRDMMNQLHPVTLFAPIAAQTNSSTARASAIIDLRGYDACTLVLINGANTDADVTFAVEVTESDDSGMSGATAVGDGDLVGTEALAASAFGDDNETRKIGYKGSKRYIQVTVTPTGNNSGDWFLAGVAILGHPAQAPTANPPQ